MTTVTATSPGTRLKAQPLTVSAFAPYGDVLQPPAAAFVGGQGQGMTYRADVWHHPLTVLDAPAAFAVFMWRDGSADDEEFVDVAPFLVDSEGVMP